MDSTAANLILPCVLERASLAAEKVILLALKTAGDLERLRPEHLFLTLCVLDPRLVSWKLRNKHVDVKKLVQRVRADVAHPGSGGDRGAEAIYSALSLVSRITPSGGLIGPTHLLAAILLENTNKVSCYLKERIDVREFIRRRFPQIQVPDLPESCTHFYGDRGKKSCRDWAGVVVPGVRRYQNPETRARSWLWKLIPEQGMRYFTDGFVEIESKRYPSRVYRIHRENRGTEIHEGEALIALACMRTVDPSFPPTDRVLAEYMLLRGDEAGYLRTAVINPVPTSA